jgi:hypothetical protein
MGQKRLKPQDKHSKPSWNRRNDARSVLQQQHAARVARALAEQEAAAALLGPDPVPPDPRG